MRGVLSFCREANQSLQVLGIMVEKREQYDLEFDETIAYLQHYNLLGKDIDFASWMKLGEFLLYKKERFKKGFEVLNKKQMMVLDQGLHDILGNSLYS